MPTRTEVDALKKNWEQDPFWDIEDTEGFEEYLDELRAFRLAKEAEWFERRKAKMDEMAASLGVPGNYALVEYLLDIDLLVKHMASELDGIRRSRDV